MRTVLLCTALLFTNPAEAQEFKAPRVVITGVRTPLITKQLVHSKYRAIKPACEEQAQALALKEAETPEQYQKRQVQEFLWCIAQEIASDGLSIDLDSTQPKTGS